MNLVRSILFFLIQFPTLLYAQINWADYSHSFPSGTLKNPDNVGLILAIPKSNNSFWAIKGRSIYFDTLLKDSSFTSVRPLDIVSKTTFDTARAQFFLHGADKNSAALYQFRVMEYPGRKILVPWKSINQFTDSSVISSSGQRQMGYLGGYRTALGGMLIVDVKKSGQQRIISTSMVAWESIRPAVSGIYTSDDLDFFLQKLQYPWAKPATGHSPAYSLSDLRLPATNNNLVFVLNADIYSKNQIQYQLIHDDRVVRDWSDNEFDNSFIWLKDFSPGQYRIRIRYAVQPRHVTEYSFEVEPAWYQSFWLKLAIFFTAAVVIGLIVFASLLVRQRRKTHREAAGRQKLQLELKALYAQLNPHFVFNALSSIQGLINLQDLKGANEYLSDFARLMRESLNRSGKEGTSLEQELNTMKTYLKLEQLRFGFLYSIHVDEQIDVSATSLPPLLWQPLLENAVKHGVAPFQQTGQITIRFNKIGNDLDLEITDTGKGTGIKETSNGFGLKLTRDRIRLLNEINNEQHISMSFKQLLPSGTEVSLTFTNWFL